MKLYEYQGKYIFKRYGINVPNQIDIDSISDKGVKVVVKSQILEGSRGKRGLVRVTDKPLEAIDELKKQGIDKFLIEEYIEHDKELYIALIMNRDKASLSLVSSSNGGVDIESQSSIFIEDISLDRGVKDYDIIKLYKYLKIGRFEQLSALVRALYRIYTDLDCELVEINPLVYKDDFIALDSKIILDDNALFKHSDLLKEISAESKLDRMVRLDGYIGIIGNGAGLTMATMDMVNIYGGKAADFYDIGGGATADEVRSALLEVSSIEGIKAIVINIFGGITRCDEVAEGIVSALDSIDKNIKLYVRLTGTNKELGYKILNDHGIKTYDDVSSMIKACVDANR
ncbi:MAG: succinate--CoA ligase [Candidatus Micrarchaeota archaeon]|nr:MAG: succinate--CoA ligase [Candidatus Micrarchaeota archaeon]